MIVVWATTAAFESMINFLKRTITLYDTNVSLYCLQCPVTTGRFRGTVQRVRYVFIYSQSKWCMEIFFAKKTFVLGVNGHSLLLSLLHEY